MRAFVLPKEKRGHSNLVHLFCFNFWIGKVDFISSCLLKIKGTLMIFGCTALETILKATLAGCENHRLLPAHGTTLGLGRNDNVRHRINDHTVSQETFHFLHRGHSYSYKIPDTAGSGDHNAGSTVGIHNWTTESPSEGGTRDIGQSVRC